jgi:putative ABC transport system ATP-binding protein
MMFILKNIKYKHILGLKDISFAHGKITAILGESGGGKTTLLKLLNQMISHDSGTIEYNGKWIESYPPVELRREVVMLTQTPAVFPGNLRDNLLIGLKFAEKVLVSDEVLFQTLTYVKLNKSLDEEVEQFSGGEKQRMALARVMLTDAKVMLLDEPTSALDRDTGFYVMDQLTKLVKEKDQTMIMVTHSEPLAEQYADEILYINRINRLAEVPTHD